MVSPVPLFILAAGGQGAGLGSSSTQSFTPHLQLFFLVCICFLLGHLFPYFFFFPAAKPTVEDFKKAGKLIEVISREQRS